MSDHHPSDSPFGPGIAMSYWDLRKLPEGLQTDGMRLPQSSSPLCSFASKTLLFLLGTVAVLNAHSHNQQLQSSSTRLSFGSVELSQSLTQSVTLTNTGKTSITISAVTSAAPFSTSGLTLPASLAAGQSTTLSITFAPTLSSWVSGWATVTSTASNSSLQIGIAGTGVTKAPLTDSPTSLSFGSINVGSKSVLPVSVTNPFSGQVILTSYQVAGAGYTVSGPSLPTTLLRGQSITLNVTFAPSASGTSNGSVFLPGAGLTIPLSGSGGSTTAGTLSVSPTSLAFGNVNVGSTGTLSSTLTATGASVTVSSASSSSSQFAVSGVSLPLTLAAGQSAQYSVTYTPSTSGALSATVTLSSNASNSTTTESLSGTGVAQTFTVSLSWNPSTSSVTGYNVYRGTVSGVYTKINGSLDPSTSYTDTTAAGGTTYYYAATSVNSSGQESTYSSPIQVVIP